jgi:putative endonuclease
MSHRVYLIENPAGRRYIGLPADVPTRVAKHNAGMSKWTAKHGPWRLAWTSRLMNPSAACKLENSRKRQKGGDGLHPLLARFGTFISNS